MDQFALAAPIITRGLRETYADAAFTEVSWRDRERYDNIDVLPASDHFRGVAMRLFFARTSLWLVPLCAAVSVTAQEKKRVDLDGRPLPERAICRLGTNWFIHPRPIARTA